VNEELKENRETIDRVNGYSKESAWSKREQQKLDTSFKFLQKLLVLKRWSQQMKDNSAD